MVNKYFLQESPSHMTGFRVFISYHENDKKAAKIVADYFLKCGVDIYFDEYKTSIGDNLKVSIETIKTGIQHSSHMLCILSHIALKSHLMPWEIGYGYDTVQVVGLTIKEMSKSELPEYLQVVPILRGTKSLNTYIANTIGSDENSLIREQKLFSASQINHPLDDILDWQL